MPKSRIGLRIIFEDRWLVVVDKTSGLLSVSATGNGDTAISLLSDYFGRRVFVVHRLDRDTSGLMVFAKDWETKNLLQSSWDDSVLERRYEALVRGCPGEDEGVVVSWLKEHPKSLKMSSCPYDNGGQKAITRYKVLSRGDSYSLVEFKLETGRKNQIRVHSALMGCPVAGDRKYWDDAPFGNPIGRLALHAEGLAFIHPHTGKTMKFKSPLPGNFKAF